MKKEILALSAGLLLLSGCAQKGIQTGTESGSEGVIEIEQSLGHNISRSTVKAAVEAAAKEEGWNSVPLGDRKVIVDKYFSETKNIAAEISIRNDGYTVEYSSGQNISKSEAENLLEELKEKIDEQLEKAPAKH